MQFASGSGTAALLCFVLSAACLRFLLLPFFHPCNISVGVNLLTFLHSVLLQPQNSVYFLKLLHDRLAQNSAWFWSEGQIIYGFQIFQISNKNMSCTFSSLLSNSLNLIQMQPIYFRSLLINCEVCVLWGSWENIRKKKGIIKMNGNTRQVMGLGCGGVYSRVWLGIYS